MKQFTIWWLLVACSISTVVRSQAVSASPQQLQHRQATPNEQQQPLHQETAGARSLSFTTGWAQDSWRSFPDASAQVASAAPACLRAAFGGNQRRERRQYSQVGEDGILEAIFACIGATSRTYAEFGVQDGRECSTRWLREHYNFSGLWMDGGYERPEVNLQKEMIDAENIVGLLTKYGVPLGPVRGSTGSMSGSSTSMGGTVAVQRRYLDQLTVDLDQNTFWVAREVLQGGFRPRSLTIEVNRNPGPSASIAALYMPREQWQVNDFHYVPGGGATYTPGVRENCYFGASVVATARLAAHYGYELVAIDGGGVNAFFVHASALGAPGGLGGSYGGSSSSTVGGGSTNGSTGPGGARPYQPGSTVFGSIEQAITATQSYAAWDALHGPCYFAPWLEVGPSVAFSDPGWTSQLRPVFLATRRAPPAAGVSPLRRVFYEVEGVTLGQVVLHPRTASPLGSSTAVQPLGGEPLPLKPSKGRGKGSATGGTAGSTIGTAGGTVTAVSRDAAHRAAVQAAVQGKGHNASGCDVWMARAVHALQAVQPTAAVQAVQERRHGGWEGLALIAGACMTLGAVVLLSAWVVAGYTFRKTNGPHQGLSSHLPAHKG